jgi:hypothetical protein
MKSTYWLFGTRLTVLADQTNTGGRTTSSQSAPNLSIPLWVIRHVCSGSDGRYRKEKHL